MSHGGVGPREWAGAAVAGGLFGLGLVVSGMTNPANVLAFLDVTGAWDPRLALVMAAAVAVAAPAFAWVRRSGQTFSGTPVHLPGTQGINRRLILGSLLFGVGWGLVGICPGPGLVAAGLGNGKALWFVGAMLVGMLAWGAFAHRRSTH